MSWSLTFNDLREYGPDLPVLPEHITDYIGSAHPEYLNDLTRAYKLAKELDLASANLSGTRTPNPYGGDEVVDISIRGLANAPDFQGEMMKIINAGPHVNQMGPLPIAVEMGKVPGSDSDIVDAVLIKEADVSES